MGAHAHTGNENETSVEVLSVSDRNPKVRTVRVHRPDRSESSYVRATFKGLGVTVKHFFRNVITKSDVETIQYPEETITYPERSRGLHRLMQREDQTARCVACMCCPTVCPADCITITPVETADGSIEKAPAIFEIDTLRCVVCGLCVEACPCDAIRMDTGQHALPVETRGAAILDKDTMLALGAKSIATQGGVGPDWRESS